MGSSLTRIARDIVQLKRQVKHLASTPQLAYSSVEDGSLDVNVQGQQTMVIGRQFDGTSTAAVVGGPPPPAPSGVTVQPVLGGLTAHWDGTFEDDALTPMNFSRVTFHVVENPLDFTPLANIAGEVNTATGGLVFINLPPVEFYVFAVAWDQAGQYAVQTTPAFATPLEIEGLPTDPPADSPALRVTGTTDSLIVEADDVAPSTVLRYYISTTPSFTKDSTTLYATTRSTVQIITGLADGTRLSVGSSYYVAVIAENVAGEAAPSAEVEATLDPTNAAEAAYARLVSGFILAGQIQVGAATWDPDNGLVFPQPDGGEIRFPVDGVSAARITAHLIARSLDVEDNANFYGLSQLFGQFRLSNGINNPTVEPSVSNTWDSVQIDDAAGNPIEGAFFGLAESADGASWSTAFNFSGLARFVASKTTGASTVQYSSGTNVAAFAPDGGMVYLGGKYYVLGRDYNRGFKRYVYRCHGTTFAKEAEWEITNSFSTLPAIGVDFTTSDLLIAWISSAGNTLVQVRDVDDPTVQIGSNINLGAPPVGSSTLVLGVARGNFDLGADRTFVTFNSPNTAYCYNTSTLARVSARDFPIAGGGNVVRGGFVWEDGQFWHLGSQGKVWEYDGGVTQNTSTDIGYSWFDDVDPDHETTLGSSTTTFTRSARAKVRVETPPAPQLGVLGSSDIANQIRIYAATTGSTLRLQATLLPGDRTHELDTLATATATPQSSNGFIGLVGVAPGEIASDALAASGKPHIQLLGSGAARLAKLLQSDEVDSGTMTADTFKDIAVTFPVPFDAPPTITVGLKDATTPSNFSYGHASVTSTGFIIRAKRISGTAAFTLSWQAVAKTVA